MSWPNELELELTSMAQGGDAIGRHEGRAVFAAGGLPRELVRVRLFDRQKAFARGRVIEVLQPAPERVTSFCPLEQRCGAADWRWINYDAQRQFKADILREQLQHLGGIDVAVTPSPSTTAEATRGYRTTVDLHVAGTQIGYYLPGSRRVSDVPSCCLHHPLINSALDTFRPLLSSNVALRSISVRCSPSSGEVLAIVDGKGPLRELAQAWQQTFPALVGVTHSTTRQALVGRSWLEQRIGPIRFHVSASSFFQINAHQINQIVERVQYLLHLTPSKRLLDLYCGVGLFALTNAAQAETVVGIEEWAPAIEDARRSAQLNAIGNVRFELGKVEQVLATLTEPFDRVVLDPPRRGCAPEVLSVISQLAPERIVYVSCHPGTLARDCKQLVAAGYRVTSAEVIDMFPHTHHVESIVLLERS